MHDRHRGTRRSLSYSAEVSVHVTPDRQEAARPLLDRLAVRAEELDPYRGRALRSAHAGGLARTVIDPATTLTRGAMIVDERVCRKVSTAFVEEVQRIGDPSVTMSLSSAVLGGVAMGPAEE